MMVSAAIGTALVAALSSLPNIVLVTIDTLRADHLGAYGSTLGATPHLDALASQGARFENALSTAPLTRPAHASLFTGLYPPQHGVRDNLPAKLDDSIPTLTRKLSAAGYRTAGFVGSFLLGRGSGLESGFDVFSDGSSSGSSDVVGPSAERRAEEVADEAIAFLASAQSPFFLWVHFYDPHAPYEPPPPFEGKGYAGEIAYADAQLGRVLEALRARGVFESTLVVAAADHGEGLGDHGEEEHGVLVYQETIRVPLLLRGPGVPRGTVTREPVSLVDVAPTLLSAAGLESGGASLLAPRTRPIYFESYYGSLHFGWAPLRGVRQGPWKLVFAPRPEIFDLSADPEERSDLSQSRKDEARRLYAELRKLEEGARETSGGASAADLEKLASLGYAGSRPRGATGADPKDEIAKYSDFARKLRDATTRFHRGEWKSAEPIFRELASRDILSFEVHLYLARCARLAGDVPEAIREYDAAAAIYDQYSLLHLERGRALSAAGDLRGAVAAFERSLSISPSAPAEAALATAARKLGDVPRAIEALNRAVSLDPGDAESWNQLGALLLSREEIDAAIAAFEKAVSLRPEDEMFRHNLDLARDIRNPP